MQLGKASLMLGLPAERSVWPPKMLLWPEEQEPKCQSVRIPIVQEFSGLWDGHGRIFLASLFMVAKG